MGRGAISDRAREKRRPPVIVFGLFLAAGLIGFAGFTVPTLVQLFGGDRHLVDAAIVGVVVPLVFVAVGGLGLVLSLRKPAPGGLPSPADLEPALPSWGPVILEPAYGPWAKLIGVGIFAVLWNGFLAIPASQIHSKGFQDFGIVFAIFLVPFFLVGLVLLVMVAYFLLAALNPRPVLRVSSPSVPLGGGLDLEWEFTGASHRLRGLKILLEGREEATYRRGTDTVTDKHVFHRSTIHQADEMGTVERGRARIEVPRDSAPSWKAENNKIVWVLKVRGEIRRWPDVDEEFPLEVLPSPPEAAR